MVYRKCRFVYQNINDRRLRKPLSPIFRQPRGAPILVVKKNVAQSCRLGNKAEYVH